MAMIKCPQCPDWMDSLTRTRAQKLVYSGAYACPSCEFRMHLHRRFIVKLCLNHAQFILSRHSCCITCGSGSVRRGNHADSIAKHPLGWIQRLTGAPRLACSYCRTGYFDWRSPRRPVVAASAGTASDLVALSLALGESAPATVPATSDQPADLTASSPSMCQ